MRKERLTGHGLVKIIEPLETVKNLNELKEGDVLMIDDGSGDCMPYSVVELEGKKAVVGLFVNRAIRIITEIDNLSDRIIVYRATIDTEIRTNYLDNILSVVLFIAAMSVYVYSRERILLFCVLLLSALALQIKSNVWRVE